ncbi:MFS transporter [Pseudomonas matsuisoli]|uniref:MFS transporter n=1 Tax=Pseudomonas matsuisoli TaxID=1515666 RepID=A0A917US95_9PSED|nr:MFS transporter [Pseudomonas matsuisoli]GGJ81554.1 MFS transporter [Pseudomonas matsuisoli]
MVLAAINLRPGITSLAPLIERVAAELSLGRGIISLTTALPVMCMGLLAPLAPRLALRFGLERTITGCLALLGLSLLLRLGSHNSALLILSAACLGMAIAIIGPLMAGFIKRQFREQSGRVVGWYSLSMAVGGSAGAVLTVPWSHALGDDWTLGLTVWAVPALIAFALWLFIPNVKEPFNARETGRLPWTHKRAWLITVFFSLQAGVFYALATWLVARYSEAGFSALRANTLFSTFMLVGLPAAYLVPWAAHRFQSRYRLLQVCGAVATTCLAMVTFKPLVLPDLWAVLMGIALTGSFSLSMLLPMHEAQSPMAVSRWTAMMLCAGYCIACTAPVLAGVGRDAGGSYVLPFTILTLMAMTMVLLALWLGQTSRTDGHA